jgi:stage II sporulation protein R
MISLTLFTSCDVTNDIVRIHIRGNSNLEFDQEVKLKVRDEVVDYISPLIADCKDSVEVKSILRENLNEIENVADNVLINNGFDYTSTASINNEYFPTREYDGEVFPADYYDALILNLGSGEGNNWWCVAYPPLCFVGEVTDGDVKYKSKLIEMINKYFGR